MATTKFAWAAGAASARPARAAPMGRIRLMQITTPKRRSVAESRQKPLKTAAAAPLRTLNGDGDRRGSADPRGAAHRAAPGVARRARRLPVPRPARPRRLCRQGQVDPQARRLALL